MHYWSRSYADHDRIWLGSGALEMPAYREMAKLKSQLSQDGRDHCRMIEKACGIPTYYYLFRYYGKRRSELERLCPGCGRRWLVRKPDPEDLFFDFHFRCDRCRLVSHAAVDFSNPAAARI